MNFYWKDKSRYSISVLTRVIKFGFGLVIVLMIIGVSNCSNGVSSSQSYWENKVYPLRYQPELDRLNFKRYFRNKSLVKFQMKCFFYGGPCDAGKNIHFSNYSN